MNAIIIAAGDGKRISDDVKSTPKALIDVNGQPIINYQIQALREVGINNIVIITGKSHEKFGIKNVHYIHDSNSAKHDILGSLMEAKDFLKDDVIILYSDIIFETKIIRQMLDTKGDISIAVDMNWEKNYEGRTGNPLSEAENVLVNEEKNILSIKKNIKNNEYSLGEFAGIVKFSKPGGNTFVQKYEEVFKENKGKFHDAPSILKAYLTDMLQELIDSGIKIEPVFISGNWYEIDTLEDLEIARKNIKKIRNDYLYRSGINFLGILNNLKRRPKDAAEELGVPLDDIVSIINGEKEISYDIIKRATEIWPINIADLFLIQDDCPNGVKIMRAEDSKKSQRIMDRGGLPYYEYRDTAMSKVAPFRPEWILELCSVSDNDPTNNLIQWNNGHFLHQFTYFIGNVNFYYIDKDGKKQTAVMNTGDSMYITPFVPHTFATRSDSESKGLILAITYGGKLNGESQRELSSMYNLGTKFALDFSSMESASSSLLKFHREISTISLEELSKRTCISLQELESFESGLIIPQLSQLEKIATALTINVRDLLPNNKIENKVIIKKHKDTKIWYYPENTKCYKFHELASTTALPFSKSFEVYLLNSDNSELDLQLGLHQYVYNIGETSITLNWELNDIKYSENIHPNDSLYIKPFVKHNFRGNGKLLILGIAGKMSGDVQRELSIIGKEHAKRTISDTSPWFGKKGQN